MIIQSVAILALAASGLTAHQAERSEAAATSFHDEQVLFQAGTDGYSCFRIPAVVRTTKGTLLAFAEGRVNTCSDTGDIDTVLRRSTDGGRTWGPIQVVIDGNGDTRGNPVPVVDAESGRISLLTTRNPGDDQQKRHPFLQHSTDDGATWTEPKDITDQVSKPEWEHWYGTGPVHGIQLQHGEHQGRLVVPSYFSEGEDQPGGVVLVYSDDGGITWQRGAIARHEGTTLIPGENTIVELSDGRIYDSAREGGSTPEPGNRASAISSDGGETFDAPFETEPELPTPMVQAATLRLGDRLLFSSPAHPAAREAMAIRSSYDEAQTWDPWSDGKVFWWGPSAYSDLVRIDDTLSGLLYEAGKSSPYESIRWSRFDEEFLSTPNGDPPGIPDPPEPGPRTPDTSEFGHDSYVRGNAVLGAGHDGKALVLDGADDRVEIPYAKTLDLADSDFTWSMWFRYSETTGSRTLLWAYRMGGNTTPQAWLRAEPQSNRIRGFLGTGLGTVAVDAPGAYNDGEWHRVTFGRGDGKLTIQVDDNAMVSANAPLGSVTEGQDFGVYGFAVGQRVDGAGRFKGTIDDIEVRKGSDPILRLPFEEIGVR